MCRCSTNHAIPARRFSHPFEKKRVTSTKSKNKKLLSPKNDGVARQQRSIYTEKKKSTEGFDWTTVPSVLSCSLFSFFFWQFVIFYSCFSFSKVSHRHSRRSGPARTACLGRAPGRSAHRPQSSSPPG